MTKFEYKIATMNGDLSSPDIVKKLNVLGKEGWELCTLRLDGSYTFILKKRIKATRLKPSYERFVSPRVKKVPMG